MFVISRIPFLACGGWSNFPCIDCKTAINKASYVVRCWRDSRGDPFRRICWHRQTWSVKESLQHFRITVSEVFVLFLFFVVCFHCSWLFEGFIFGLFAESLSVVNQEIWFRFFLEYQFPKFLVVRFCTHNQSFPSILYCILKDLFSRSLSLVNPHVWLDILHIYVFAIFVVPHHGIIAGILLEVAIRGYSLTHTYLALNC